MSETFTFDVVSAQRARAGLVIPVDVGAAGICDDVGTFVAPSCMPFVLLTVGTLFGVERAGDRLAHGWGLEPFRLLGTDGADVGLSISVEAAWETPFMVLCRSAGASCNAKVM